MLIAHAGGGGDGSEIQTVGETVALLLRKGSREELRQLPLYRMGEISGPPYAGDSLAYEQEFYWRAASWSGSAVLADRWKREEREVRAHWEQILPGPAKGSPRG